MKVKLKEKHIKRISRLLMVLYLLIVVYFMFFAENFGRTIVSENYRYNLTPLKEIKRFKSMLKGDMWFQAVVNLAGNVLCFVPIGIVLPITANYWKQFHRVVIFSMTFSLVIEFTQLISKVGSFDVDDIILNTVGGLTGYIIYYFSRKIYQMGDKT